MQDRSRRQRNVITWVILTSVVFALLLIALAATGGSGGSPPATTPFTPPYDPEDAAPPDSFSLIQADLIQGTINLDEAVLLQLQAIYEADQLPAPYRSTTPIYEGTWVMRGIAEAWDDLLPETREAVLDYLGAGEWENEINGLPVNGAASMASLAPVQAQNTPAPTNTPDPNEVLTMETAHFYIRYRRADEHIADLTAEGLEDAYDHFLEAPEDGGLGFDAPGTLAHDGRYFVRITTLNNCILGHAIPINYVMRGYSGPHLEITNQATCNNNPISDNDIQSTAVHEFFHVIQFGYDWEEDLWWMEATAKWAEQEVYAWETSYADFAGKYLLGHPELPLDFQVPANEQNPPAHRRLHVYAAGLFAVHLSNEYGADIVEDIWDRASGSTTAVAAVNAELAQREGLDAGQNAGWAAVWPAFIQRNYRGDYPGVKTILEAYKGRIPTGLLHPDESGTSLHVGALDHLSAAYVRIESDAVPAQGSWILHVEIEAGAAGALPKSLVSLAIRPDCTTLVDEEAARSGQLENGILELEFGGFGSTINAVVLAFGNPDTAASASFELEASLREDTTAPEGTAAGSVTILVTDISGSMDEYWHGQTKIEGARDAALRIVNMLEQESAFSSVDHQAGVVSFSDYAEMIVPLTTDFNDLRDGLRSLQPMDMTNLGAGLIVANDMLEDVEDDLPRYIILLSDGINNEGLSNADILAGPAAYAGEQGACIYTVGFGDATNLDEDLLRAIADRSDCGAYYHAESMQALADAYIRIRHEAAGAIISEQHERIHQDETVTAEPLQVPEAQDEMHLSLSWAGSALDLLLQDPLGRTVDETYPGASLAVYDDMINLIVANPMPGEWPLAVFGREVPEGELEFGVVASVREQTLPPSTGGGGAGIAVILLALAAGTVWLVASRRSRPGHAAAAALLIVESGPLAGQRIPIPAAGITIGRSSTSQLRLADPAVSRRHARIRYAEGAWFLQDQGSSGGTYVNGHRFTAGRLQSGDRIAIGNSTLHFTRTA